MLDYTLSTEELAGLRQAHSSTNDKREADWIKAVLLLATGWSAEQLAEILPVDANTVRNHFKSYRRGGLGALSQVAYRGRAPAPDAARLAWLNAHLQSHLYTTAKQVAAVVEEQLGMRYTESGMTALRHRLGFVYKQPTLVPGKTDPGAYIDAVHPHHNLVLACGWSKRGARQQRSPAQDHQRVQDRRCHRSGAPGTGNVLRRHH